MKLSVLIATLGKRHVQFESLLENLLEQAKAYPDEIEVIAYRNHGEKSIGEIRQALLESATGDYVCFIDDDDDIPDYYCKEIMDNLGEDYIGFMVNFYDNGEEKAPVYHSLRYPGWFQDADGYYRGVTHLNPIRRELALKGTFAGGMGEDEDWARQVRPHVKTENYINRHMYFYYHVTAKSHFYNPDNPRNKNHRVVRPKSKQFKYHPESSL